MARWGTSFPSPKIPNFAFPVSTSFLPSKEVSRDKHANLKSFKTSCLKVLKSTLFSVGNAPKGNVGVLASAISCWSSKGAFRPKTTEPVLLRPAKLPIENWNWCLTKISAWAGERTIPFSRKENSWLRLIRFFLQMCAASWVCLKAIESGRAIIPLNAAGQR